MARSRKDGADSVDAEAGVTRKVRRKAKSTKPPSVSEGRASSRQVYGMVLLSTVLVLFGILMYLWPQMRMVELGYQQSALRSQQRKVLQRQKELQVELSSLRRLDRIEKLAVDKLDMRTPLLSQVIYLREKEKTVSARTMP